MEVEVSAWHWRQALQIAAQIPEGKHDAWLVMGCIEQLLNVCHRDPPPTPPTTSPEGQLLRFPRVSRTPRRRATSSGKPSGLPK